MSMVGLDLMKLPDNVKIYNDEGIEKRWAQDAHEYAETYEYLLKTCKNIKNFHFTHMDDLMYESFRSIFPDMNIEKLNLDVMKGKKNKLLWYTMLENWKESLKDYNSGTLLRVDCALPFGPENCTVVPRSQFYCIEIARNREGFNENFINSLQEKKE